MAIPRVVIVGRPNVGKSSIFNWLDGRRLAIVDDQAGVTRDRMVTLIEHDDHYFELIDTGGMGVEDSDNLTKEVELQIAAGIDEADVILLVVDTKAGLTPLDEVVGERLRKIDKPVLLLANKTDHAGLDNVALEFHRLGRGWLIPVSTLQNRNRQELFDAILERLPEHIPEAGELDAPRMKLAIVGRRNVGKSTFVNTLAQAQRMIVSEVPGTTRDSVDVHFNLDGHRFVAIDTPGLRRNKSIRTDIDFYGLHRAQRSIRRSDVTLLFFDCMEPISKVDKKLAHYIEQQFRPCIFVVNKWDKVAGQVPTERWVRYLREHFPTMAYCPIAFVTGMTGKNVKTLLNHAQMLFKQAQTRVSTPKINKLLRAALQRQQPPLHMNRRPKVYFASQIAIAPPTVILMCNMPQGFPPSYRRYLLNVFRDHLPFSEVPLKMYLQKRESQDLATRQGKSAANELEQDDLPLLYDDDQDFIDDPTDEDDGLLADEMDSDKEWSLDEEFIDEDEPDEDEPDEDELHEGFPNVEVLVVGGRAAVESTAVESTAVESTADESTAVESTADALIVAGEHRASLLVDPDVIHALGSESADPADPSAQPASEEASDRQDRL